jgi:hypothetical protein
VTIDPAAPLDDLLKFQGVPRSELEARLRELVPRLAAAELRIVRHDIEGCLTCKSGRDYRQMLTTLTATQARCTELLTEVRAYRASGICLPGVFCYACRVFNGFMREKLTECRACGRSLVAGVPPGVAP